MSKINKQYSPRSSLVRRTGMIDWIYHFENVAALSVGGTMQLNYNGSMYV